MTHELIILKNQFDQIASTKGKAKIPLIKIFANDPSPSGYLFRDTYNFVFNPHISTGLAKKKMQKELPPTNSQGLDQNLHQMFKWIEKNCSGSDNVIRFVQSWIQLQPPETWDFLKNVFINDLQIGASEKAINEALGYDFIPVWDVMLAKRWEKEEHKVKGDFTVTLKMDDYRATCIYDDLTEKWEIKARSGLLYEDCVEIEAILEDLPTDFVYDGGLISADDSLESKDRFRATGKILKKIGPKTGLMFYIYDMLPKDEFLKGKSKLGYAERQHNIDKLIAYYNDGQWNNKFQKVPQLYEGNNKEVIMPLLEDALKNHYEGLMVNTNDGKYETKRASQLLKVKEFYTVDVKVVGYKEYKHPDMLGAFVCEWKNGNTFNVGGGFKQHERVEFWKNREDMIGKIIEVRYFQESKNQNGGDSIRHGHFVGVRNDKKEPSFH